jgi:hypothetical protein
MTLKRYRGEYGVVKYSDCVNGVAPWALGPAEAVTGA